MSPFRTVELRRVWEMLDRCAPAYTKNKTDHYWCIRYEGRTYPSFPLGPHGRRENPEIEFGHVRKMARMLGIWDCSQDFFAELTG
jgi:hypothetical protein